MAPYGCLRGPFSEYQTGGVPTSTGGRVTGFLEQTRCSTPREAAEYLGPQCLVEYLDRGKDLVLSEETSGSS